MTTMKDLTGCSFGRWTVVAYAGHKQYGKTKVNVWHCKCECGNEKDIPVNNLLNGMSLSCGCARLDAMKEVSNSKQSNREISTVGTRFGKLTVESYNRQTKKCTCRCDCGNIVEVSYYGLFVTGHKRVEECPDCRNSHYKTKDYVGKTFGDLTVLCHAGDSEYKCGRKYSWWLCRCKCGYESMYSADYLRMRGDERCACTECLSKRRLTRRMHKSVHKVTKEQS